MCLPDNVNLNENLKRIINNSFFDNHPFRSCPGQLGDFISIFDDIRNLPNEKFTIVVSTITKVVEKNKKCDGCYGKGLAFMKFLCKDIDNDLYEKWSKQYDDFSKARDRGTDSEKEIKNKLDKNS